MLIDIRHLKSVNCATSTEATRYYLNGVFVEVIASHIHYTATDGHIMLCSRQESSDVVGWPDGGVIVPRELINQIKIGGLCEDFSARITSDGKMVKIVFRYQSIEMPAIDGTFPDYRRVVPQSTDGTVAQFNMELFARLVKAQRFFTNDCGPLGIAHNGDGPALVKFNRCDADIFGVVMPMRNQSVMTTAPDWLKHPVPNENKIKEIA